MPPRIGGASPESDHDDGRRSSSVLVNHHRQKTPTTRTGMKPAKTQNPAARAASTEMPSARPDIFAAIPVAAAPTAKPILCTVAGAAAARMRSFSLERCTMRRTIEGQERPNPRPSNSPQTTMPGSDPIGTVTMNPAIPTTTNPTPVRINILAAEIGALETIMVAALHASASPARIYPDIKGSMPNMVFRINGP